MSGEQAPLFDRYLELLLEWNAHTNLTAIREPNEIRERHFQDSLYLLEAYDFRGKRVIDVGSGAGFPGIPIKIAENSIRLTLLEATGKKARFLQTVCDELGLTDVKVLNTRAEEKAHRNVSRETFDISVARGVAALPVLCELCLPFVRIGGVMLAMKESADELENAAQAIHTLGGRAETPFHYRLPSGKQHTVLKIRKERNTPPEFPRPWGVMKRRVL